MEHGAERKCLHRLNTPGGLSSLDAWARGWGRSSHLGKTAKRWRGDGPRGHSAQGWVWLEPGVYKGNGELLIRFFFHQQDNVDQSSSEDLCYTLINHSVPRGRPSEISSEGCYENVSPKTETPRKSLGETETSYALLRVPSSPRHFSSPEEEYELVMPQRISFHPLQQPHLPLLPSETQVTYLE